VIEEGIIEKLRSRTQQLRRVDKEIDFVDISGALAKTRLVKEREEIDLIQKACGIADKTIEKIPDMLQDGVREGEIAAEIDYMMRRNGADKPAFDTIASFGRNTSQPHYTHGETPLKKGDFAVFDIGARYKRYNSDVTRTFVYGKARKKQTEIYQTVMEAQQVGFDVIKPRVKANEVHEAVRSTIDKTRFKGCFIHSTGHSLGLGVHDVGGGLRADCDLVLVENMVFTVEPGIYIPSFGGVRIEDDVVVTKNGVEVLTRSPRDFIEI
jgi:Xaa-Pro dipeptidase